MGRDLIEISRDIRGKRHTLHHFAPRANIIIHSSALVNTFFAKKREIVNFFLHFFRKVKKTLPFAAKVC